MYGSLKELKLLKAVRSNNHSRVVLTNETSRLLQQTLDDYINKQGFLKKNITIREVAEELKTQPYILSAFINQQYQMHFNEMINFYRVQYIKEGLTKAQWEDLTLEAIAQKAGFNNRTTFLTAFKKFESITPREFMVGIKSREAFRRSRV